MVVSSRLTPYACSSHRWTWGIRTAMLLVAIMSAMQTIHADRDCSHAVEEQVQSTAAFSNCYALTRLNFDDKPKKKDDLDPSRSMFCGSLDCLQVFRQLRALGGLSCLEKYSTRELPLWTDDGGMACFGPAAFEEATPAPTPTLTSVSPPSSSSSSSSASDTSPASGESASQVTSQPPPIKSNSSAGSIISSATIEEEDTPATTQPSNDTKSGDSADEQSSSPSLLPVLLASIALVGMLIGAIFFVRSGRRSASERGSIYVKGANTTRVQRAKTTTQDSSDATALSMADCDAFGDAPDCTDEIINSSRIPFEKLEFGELLSRGAYGEVYGGTYRGQLVAIKTLLPEHRTSSRQISNFLSEIKLLATLEHSRIVQFIGVAWDSLKELSVVMEFMDNGDLRTLLSGYESSGTMRRGFDASKVNIALQIAHGLTYLHSLERAVLHRDLKSRNVLLDANLNAKLTDFGVSRERSDCTMTAGVGSSLWMAPEVMMGERYDEKADIFSFGVVLSELDRHTLPYTHAVEANTARRLPETAILQMVAMGLLSVQFTEAADPVIAQLGRDCVSLDPADRPTTQEVLHRLHQSHQAFQVGGFL